MTNIVMTVKLIEKVLELRNTMPISFEQNKLLTEVANYMRRMQSQIDIAKKTEQQLKEKKLRKPKKKLIDEPAGLRLLSDIAYETLKEEENEIY